MDIIDLTMGWTMELGGRMTIANAFSVPLNDADNKTFNWEYQLQLNYYFGGPRPRPAFQ